MFQCATNRVFRRFRIAASAIGAAALFSGAAVAQQITDGDSVFSQPAANTIGATVRSGTTGGTAAVLTAGGDTTDHLFQQWWWYRVNGVTPREFALSNRTSNSAVGNVLTLTYAEPEGFNAAIRYTLTDGTNAPAACNVLAEITITSTSASSLSMALFCYLDYDLEGTTADSATLISPDRMQITDGPTGFFGQFVCVGAAAYQVASFSTVRGLLTDADVDNFNSTGLPFGPADWTGAFQWNFNLAPGASVTFPAAFSINQPADLGGQDCIGDIDGDGDRDLNDLTRLLSAFGVSDGGDVDDDGDTDLSDLTLFLSLFGVPC